MTSVSEGRRDFLKTCVVTSQALALGTVMSRPLLAKTGARWEPAPPIVDNRLRELVAAGLSAATKAGAQYADVRLTHTTERRISAEFMNDEEVLHAGVRVLVNGYWGFASSPVWSVDELVRLAKNAARQAASSARGPIREVHLAPAPPVSDEHWEMPVHTDPLTVHPLEIRDYLFGLQESIERDAPLFHGETVHVTSNCIFRVQERAFGATTGSYVTQRLYRTEGQLTVYLTRRRPGDSWTMQRSVDILTPAGLGWELIRDQPLHKAAHALIDEMHVDAALPTMPIDVGRYEAVFDAASVSEVVSRTIGLATELDRMMGYEANKGGTSYLGDPFVMLDSFTIGSPLLTVTGDRSETGGVATVQWDDDGVRPQDMTLVKDGILRDVQTSRESAGWMNAGLPRREFRSHGCAAAESASDIPITYSANLKLSPASEKCRYEDLVSNMSKGIAVKSMNWDMDFQQASGYGSGRMYEIHKGKIVAKLTGGAMLFRTTELWKSLRALGSVHSAQRYGLRMQKGQPEQAGYHSVTAVPATFVNVSVIDMMRRG